MLNFPNDPDMPALVPSDDGYMLQSLSLEEWIERALVTLQRPGNTSSLCQIAKAYDVPCSTLSDRNKGGMSQVESHSHLQNLSPAQEQVLVKWIKVQGSCSVPLTPAMVMDYTADIAGKPMGKTWIHRF